MHRGPHKSSYEYQDFLREELADMVDSATWMVLPYSEVAQLPNLRISPMGVVPATTRTAPSAHCGLLLLGPQQ
eukprot:scaffold7703_cov127-Cylindrotheca_fusiformis.AAC.6